MLDNEQKHSSATAKQNASFPTHGCSHQYEDMGLCCPSTVVRVRSAASPQGIQFQWNVKMH